VVEAVEIKDQPQVQVEQVVEDQEEMVLHLLFQVSQELHHPHL
tara:strand:- start:128 stop:256 length:129 start_codon:yes stop_codon:yes gene_type:complete